MKDDEQIFDAIWPSSASMNCYLLTSLQRTTERSRYNRSPAYKTLLMPKVQLPYFILLLSLLFSLILLKAKLFNTWLK